MNSLNYVRRKGLLELEDINRPPPADIEEAIESIKSYISSQLPLVIEVEFTPVCFDISKDQNRLVIGGQYGNLGIFDLGTRKMTKDIELVNRSITSVQFAMEDYLVIAATENGTIFFLEFPSFYLRNTLNFSNENLILKVGYQQDTLYISDGTNKIKRLDLETYNENFIETEEIVTYFDLCNEGNMVAFGFENGSVKLYHYITESFLQSTSEYTSPIKIIKFSQNSRYLAAGFADFVLKVWNIDPKMTVKHTFACHQGLIRGMAFVNDNKYLITGGADKKIILYDMKIESLPYYFELFDSEILCFKTSPKCDVLYFSQDMNKLMIYQIPQLSKNVVYRKHTGKINKIMFIPGTFDLLSIGDDGLAVLWDYQSNTIQESVRIEGRLLTGIISSSAQYAFLSSTRPSLIRLNLGSYKYYDYEISSPAVSMRFSSDENLLAIGDELFRIIIFDSVIMERKYIIKGHTDIVTEIYFLEIDTYVITCSKDTKLIKWDNSTSSKISTYDGHSSPVKCMVVTRDEELAVSGDENNEVIVWSIKKNTMMNKIIQGPSKIGTTDVFVSKDKSYLITAQDSVINYWETKSLALIFQKNAVMPAGSIAVTKNENTIAIAEGNIIRIEENPLKSTKTKIVGKSYGSPHKFMNYIKEVMNSNYRGKHLDTYNHWIFTPYRFGIAHILAYINKEASLSASLLETDNRSSFCSTINDENPLSISVKMNHKSCIESCLKYLKLEFIKGNTRAYTSLSNCLTDLTCLEIPSIPKLYDVLFQQNKSLHLPAFCIQEKTSLPSLYHSKEFLVNVEGLLPEDCKASHGESIIFYSSLCPLNLEIGSEGSIKFLQSILNCSYPEIFRSKLLQVLLRDKWERINWATYAQGMLYILYMVQLSIFCIFFKKSAEFLIGLFVVHVLLYLYEVLQIVTDFYDYWQDKWNLLDQLRSIAFTIYAYMEWQGNYNSTMLLTVIIFSWTRGILYFRVFEGTRYMVRLLSEVISDMKIFSVILAYSTVAFTFILFLNDKKYGFGDYLTIAYQINLGNFTDDYEDLFDWIIFFFATMINPLIMLNLLISIMANTYSRVKEGNDIANFQELAEMILEVEKLMLWKRANTQQYYLQQCISLTSVEENEGDKSLERLKALRSLVLKIERGAHYISSSINTDKLRQLKVNIESINNRERTYKDLFTKNQEILKSTNDLLLKLANKLDFD